MDASEGNAARRPHGLTRESGFAAAIYGSILVAGLVGALHRYGASAESISLSLLGTMTVFWLAHVWSALLGERIETRSLVGWARVKGLAAEEWPMVEAGILPFLALSLAWAGVYSDKVGVDLALAIAVAQLVGWGIFAARHMDASWPEAVIFGALDGALGMAIVALEIFIH